jgi:hydroxymethylpyrimidine/phosphomethylpyrimidine kinase
MRPYVLSIAGFDPCGGAGVLSDIKTFESLSVQGLSVVTGITFQNDSECTGVEWLSLNAIKKQLDLLINTYDIKAVKFGIIEDWQYIEDLSCIVKNQYKDIFIIWDPIIRSSSGFNFVKNIDADKFLKLSGLVDLVIPNLSEIQEIFGSAWIEGIKNFKSCYVKSVKKGKNSLTNNLYINNTLHEVLVPLLNNASKHGSGCAVSACITSFIAKGFNLREAVSLSEEYMQKFLVSSETLLGIYDEKYAFNFVRSLRC